MQARYERKLIPKSFTCFGFSIGSIKKYYNSTFGANYISPQTELMMKNLFTNYTKEDIIEADILCYIVHLINNNENDNNWFPNTYIYSSGIKIRILQRMVSMQHFEKMKGIFNVDTPEEFKNKVKNIDNVESRIKYPLTFEEPPSINDIIDVEQIGRFP